MCIGGSIDDCTVNLINRGIVVRGNTVSIQFAANGDATSHTCRIDRQQTRRCKSVSIAMASARELIPSSTHTIQFNSLCHFVESQVLI